jgi:hypothetical protein
MNPSQYWTQLVNKIMSQRNCGHSEAWRIAAGANPDAATLMSAFGRSRNTVQFFNSRQAAESTPGKDQSQRQFARFVNEKQKNGLNYGAAYNAAAREHPDVFAAMSGSTRAQFANADANNGNPPAASSQLKKVFWLPEHATQEQFEAAFKGNGSTLSPLNPAKIFAGIAELTQKQRGGEYDQAIAQTKAAFPELWAAVELLSKEPV